jgi:hypothetical protein
MFEAVTGEQVEPLVSARFYPCITADSDILVWATWRRPSHAELVQAWPTRHPPTPAQLAGGWWQQTIKVLREERRKAASLERAQASRSSKAR